MGKERQQKVEKAEDNTPVQQVSGKQLNQQPESGNTRVKVNPKLDTESVTLTKGLDDDGQMQFDDYKAGQPHDVPSEYLELKNTEGEPLFVEV